MNEITKLIDKSIKDFEDIVIRRDEEYLALKKISCEMIEKESRIEGNWIRNAKRVLEYSLMPIEAYILLGIEFIREEYTNEQGYDIKLLKFSDLLLNKLNDEIAFNIKFEKIFKLLKKMNFSNNNMHKKALVMKKISGLTRIKIDEEKIKEKDIILLGAKINNINKLERLEYYVGMNNNYYLPNEDIELLDFNTGEILYKYFCNIKFNIGKSDYQVLNEYIVTSKENINIKNKSDRILFYKVAKDLAEGQGTYLQMTEVNSNILELYNKYNGFISSKYIELINEKNTKRPLKDIINKLKKDPTKQMLKLLINHCKDSDGIFDLIKVAPSIIKEEITVEVYLEAILRCDALDKNNIKLALFCEELLIEKPIVIDAIVEFLKSMYKQHIYTDNTIKILEYLRCTVKDSIVIDEALISINVNGGIINNDFIKKYIRVAGATKEKDLLDEITNKLINRNGIEVNKDIATIVYEFYRRNSDIRALEVMCISLVKNKYNLKDYNIKAKDIVKLFKYLNRNNINVNLKLQLDLLNEFSEGESIKKISRQVVEKIFLSKNKECTSMLQNKYLSIIKSIKDENDIIYNLYIDSLISKKVEEIIKNIDEIKELELAVENNESLENSIILKILQMLIYIYIKNKDYIKVVELLKSYLDKYSHIDDGLCLREIISKNYKDIELMKEILGNVDLKKVDNAHILLNLVTREFIENKRYGLLIDILEYYNMSKKYEESIYILELYIEHSEKNLGSDYEFLIFRIFENLDNEKQLRLYNLLIDRLDFPINYRESYFEFNKEDKNKLKIIEAFCNNQIQSLLAKNLALTYYYNDDEKFLKLASIGNKSDANVTELIWRKIEENFENYFYVQNILEKTYIYSEKLENLKNIVEKNDYLELENTIIFQKYVLETKINGTLGSNIKLSNIFKEEKIDALLLIDDSVELLITKYLRFKKINFRELTYKTFIIDEVSDNEFLKSGDLIKLLSNYKDLVNLQVKLKDKKRLLLEFLEDSFIINEKGFIIKSLVNIIEFEGVYINDKAIFDNIPKTIKNNTAKKIDENLILLVMQNYLRKILMNRIDNEEELLVKRRFINEVLLNANINTLNKYEKYLEEFIEGSKKDFKLMSYREKLKQFEYLNLEKKNLFVNNAIESMDTSLEVKKIILNGDWNIENEHKYLKFLLECFNYSYIGLIKKDFEKINDIIIDILAKSKNNEIDELKEDITNFLINSVRIRGIKSSIILEELNIKGIDIEYIYSKIKK